MSPPLIRPFVAADISAALTLWRSTPGLGLGVSDTPEALAAKRPYVIVGVFVIGMLLTPPDVISQTLLAVPMWVLFELGIVFSRRFLRNRPHAAGEDEQSPMTDAEMDAELDRIEREERASRQGK